MKPLFCSNNSSNIIVVLLAVLILFMWFRPDDKVRAEQIELTRNGTPVGLMRVKDNGQPEIQLIGSNSSLSITPTGIVAFDDMGHQKFYLSTGKAGHELSGPGLYFSDSLGESRAAMYLSGGSPFLTFNSHRNSEMGREYVSNLTMHATTQTAYIQLYDKDGKPTWQASGDL